MEETIKDDEKTVKEIVLDFIQHNKRHYITIKTRNSTIRPCARCFGLWIGLIVGFFFSIPFLIGIINIDNFYLVFFTAWAFVIPGLVDWSTVKLGLRKGSNKIRLITGFLYGVGVIIYLVILPANIFLKIISYGLYEGVFYLIRRKYHLTHFSKN